MATVVADAAVPVSPVSSSSASAAVAPASPSAPLAGAEGDSKKEEEFRNYADSKRQEVSKQAPRVRPVRTRPPCPLTAACLGLRSGPRLTCNMLFPVALVWHEQKVRAFYEEQHTKMTYAFVEGPSHPLALVPPDS
jgi:hypothetical protein